MSIILNINRLNVKTNAVGYKNEFFKSNHILLTRGTS